MKSKEKFLSDVVAMEFGNSRVKILYNRYLKFYKYSPGWEKKIFNFFYHKVKRPVRVLYATVNLNNSSECLSHLKNLSDLYITNVKDLLLQQKKINFQNYTWIGTDRLLGLIGALEEFEAPIITIDCGTAITFNCLDENRNFIGGVIFPGVETQVSALTQKTYLLKEVKPLFKEVNKVLEFSTDKAIASGILNEIWGGIEFLIMKILKEAFSSVDVNVVFTGGGFEYLKSYFTQWNYPRKYYRKNLVLEGILSIAKSIRQYYFKFSDE
ncbi:MAG: type III pantothenate kinase [Ignavibacteria bacterium]|nr:type III pantothenate kinase [Ignavibacteria bacterium]